jgi:hypothetical protein
MQTLILLFKDMRTILSKADSIDFNKNVLLKTLNFFILFGCPRRKKSVLDRCNCSANTKEFNAYEVYANLNVFATMHLY